MGSQAFFEVSINYLREKSLGYKLHELEHSSHFSVKNKGIFCPLNRHNSGGRKEKGSVSDKLQPLPIREVRG